jgi:DNA-binding transcriptional ArsR family regulator
LRHDDYRMVFGEQIRRILIERVERHFARRSTNVIDEDDEGSRLKESLVRLVDRVVESYQRDGTVTASLLLDELGGSLDRSSMNVPDRTFVSELLDQMRDYFITSNKLSWQVDDPTRRNSLFSGGKSDPSPELVEKTLSPLASARRIDLLRRLSNESDSLARLSRGTGMQKGHLQFHLRILLKAGLVQYDRKSRLYSITSQGAVAIDEISRLICRLAPAEHSGAK